MYVRLKYVPTISRMQQKMEKIRAAETQKVTKKALKGLSDKERQAVETVTKGIINKLLHSPMSYLRSKGAAHRLFARWESVQKERPDAGCMCENFSAREVGLSTRRTRLRYSIS